MTWMLANVTGAQEAKVAIAGGVDIVDFATPDVQALRGAVLTVAGRLQVSARAAAVPADRDQAVAAIRAVAATGVDFVRVDLMATPGLGECVRVLGEIARHSRLIAVLLADRSGDFAMIEALAAAGFAGVMLDTSGKPEDRLLHRVNAAQLVRFVSLCRSRGLICGLAGGLEAPDVPRLLALGPDILGFRGALCHRHDRRATLDSRAIAAIRRLIPPHRKAAPDRAGRVQEPGDAPPSSFDRVFIRDLVLEMSIGAYRHERSRPQRVRFEVVAEVPRRPPTVDDIGEVFSYDVILDTITALVRNRHVNLVETLAEEIAARLLEHAPVAAVTVRVEKLDVAPAVVGVEIVRRAR